MRCLLCNRPADFAGVFVPHRDPAVYGGPVLNVQLCKACRRKGRRHWVPRVEQELARRAAASRN